MEPVEEPFDSYIHELDEEQVEERRQIRQGRESPGAHTTTFTAYGAEELQFSDKTRKRRKYSYNERIKRPDKSDTERTKWGMRIRLLSDSSMKQITCCKKRRCFHRCNIQFLRERVLQTVHMNNADRRRALASMIGSGGYFIFDGNRVCAEFLSKAFRFSRQLQCTVKGTPSSSVLVTNDTPQKDRESLSKDSIITFLERLSECTGDQMPDSNEYHLPFFKKTDVYECFKKDQDKINPNGTIIASSPYFFRMWKENCFHIKVRKLNRFTKCSLCEQLRASLVNAINLGSSTKDLKRRKSLHNLMVGRERRQYKKKREMATVEPRDYMSIIIDGADQSAFGLPHFTTGTKDVRGHSLKVRVVGVLEHNVQNTLHLFTLTGEYETGANHVIEAIHRFLCNRRRKGTLPSTLFLQMDNCSRENKNRYMFSYLEALVTWGVLSVIEVSFLPIGHTHEDIDQTFSCTSERLRHNDAITMTDLMNELKLAYNHNTVVNRMLGIVNWSGLCESSMCLRNVKGIKSYRYFRFTASMMTDTHKTVNCSVRTDIDSDWKDFIIDGDEKGAGFLRFPPDLRKTPCTIVTSPPDVDAFTKRLESEEGRINSVVKLRNLMDLRDTVFHSRKEQFHWDLSNVVETESEVGVSGEEEVFDPMQTPTTSYNYELNSFVAVKPENETRAFSFWVGKVQCLDTVAEDVVTSLLIHWYEPKQVSGDLCCSKFKPSFLQNSGKGKRQPWTDTILTDSVIVNFQSLTKDHRIPCATQKLLREHSSTVT